MKLDVTCMRYLTKDDYRMLVAVEMGMRNHELVPVDLITTIAKLRHGGAYKILSTLLRHKLVAHENQSFNGYRLSYLGYDILALRTLVARGVIHSVGRQIGVGKESDVFEALDEHGNEIVLKIHRLGRTSFRAVRRQRDYMAGKSKASWLYMSRLAALKEFAFMQALHAHGFPTPTPIDHNRHVVAMSRVSGFPMAQIKAGSMYGAELVFNNSLAILRRLAECGLVHCDFNEFNLMLDESGNVTLIDFPQMVSTSHPNAGELFARDMNGLVKFFAMKMRYVPPEEDRLRLEDITVMEAHIDEEVRASGFSGEEDDVLLGFIHSNQGKEEEGDDDEDEEDEEEEGEGEGRGGGEGGEEEAATAVAAVAIGGGEGGGGEEAGKSVFSFEVALKAPATKKKSAAAAVAGTGGEASGEGEEGEEEEEEEDEEDFNEMLEAGEDEMSDLDDNEDVGSLATATPLTQPLSEQDQFRAREQARHNLHRRGGRGGRGGGGKQSRNHTKKVNKYGKVERACADW